MDPVPASPPVLRGMQTRRRAVLRSVAAVGSIYKLMCLASLGRARCRPSYAVRPSPDALRRTAASSSWKEARSPHTLLRLS
jgi:hypothetical protein